MYLSAAQRICVSVEATQQMRKKKARENWKERLEREREREIRIIKRKMKRKWLSVGGRARQELNPYCLV